MRTLIPLIALLGLGTAALADEPPPAPAAEAAASTSTDSAKAAEDAAAAKAKEVDKSLRAKGYKPMVKNGKTYYCRSEAQLGSRFQNQVCGTPEDLAYLTRESKDFTNRAQTNIDMGNAK